MKNEEDNRYSEIGQRIRDARERMKKTQAWLAAKLEFDSPTAISLIESGKRTVSIVTLEKIGDILGVSIDYLLGKEEAKPSLRIALRASGDLDEEAEQSIVDFVEFMRRKHGRK